MRRSATAGVCNFKRSHRTPTSSWKGSGMRERFERHLEAHESNLRWWQWSQRQRLYGAPFELQVSWRKAGSHVPLAAKLRSCEAGRDGVTREAGAASERVSAQLLDARLRGRLGTVETGIYKRPWKSVVEAGDRIRFVGRGAAPFG